jgi:hypothetical protein
MADANSMVMMALGDFRFSLNTAAYQELSRTNSWRWPTVDRIGARPASQFVGPGEDSIRISGQIFPHFRGGVGQIDAMRAEADKGEPLILVDGTGRNWGKYVITDISEGQGIFFSNGAPRRQDFDISLQAYGGEDANQMAAASLTGALPSLATPSLDSVISGLGSMDPVTAANLVASKAMISMPNVRSVMGMTTAGVDSLTSAISTVASVFGSVSSEVEALQRAATAVPNAVGSLLSSPSLSTFSAFGVDIGTVVAAANAAGTSPLDAVLDSINGVGASTIIPRLVTDKDQVAALTALAEVRADG